MQTTFVLEVQFAPAEEYRTIAIDLDNRSNQDLLHTYSYNFYELRAFCMYDKVIAFDENNGSIRAEY